MPALTLALLGPPLVIRADSGAVVFRSRKHLALLAYLAVEQRHSHSRDTLLGLLWPEAKERIADTAYCTIESKGSGQVILFACAPNFRGWFRGTARLLANAVVYGPGAGARQPTGW